MKINATGHYGAATVGFSIDAASAERVEELAYGLGAGLEGGDLGHEGHLPLDEDLYNAARWETGEEEKEHYLRAA